MANEELEVALCAGQKRERRANRSTQHADVWREGPGEKRFRKLFFRHYPQFRGQIKRFDQPGVAVVVIDQVRGRVAGVGCVAARVGEPNALIVGRHSEAQLLLTGDGGVSLRHLLLLVEPVTDLRRGGGVTYRVLDLRSKRGFRTEEGECLAALRCDGPAFVSSGNYLFFFFVTGDHTDWPSSPRWAWSFIPERIYLEERAFGPAGTDTGSGLQRRGPLCLRRSITLVERSRGPSRVDCGPLVREGEERIAELVVAGPRARVRLPVGQNAVERGILFGRDQRCDSSAVLCHGELSRVHMLVIEIAGAIYAFDTASSNGCYRRYNFGDRFRIRKIGPGENIFLGSHAAIHWRPT